MYFDIVIPNPLLPGLNALTAQNPVPLNTEFVVGGYYKPGDGGGGTFIWIPGAPITSPDGGITFNAVDVTGHFQRIFSGPVNVRWFGAKGNGVADDTTAVNNASLSKGFANNGTLYFPVGNYVGAFVFDLLPGKRNEINITGDGHGSILTANGSGQPVVKLGDRVPDWEWAKISNLTISGFNIHHSTVPPCNGVEISNPSSPDLNVVAGRWVFERIVFTNCKYGVYKPYGNIANHFLDCTWIKNVIGVYATAVPKIMHSGCDRYSGGEFHYNKIGLKYHGEVTQIIVDGSIFEYNDEWAIEMICTGASRMTYNAICLRNVWFEGNGNGNGYYNGTGKEYVGGSLRFQGVRSVRIDDSNIIGKVRLIDSSVNLYNCQISSDAGGAVPAPGGVDLIHIDEKSSLVAYELRYISYVPTQVFVNSISYDGSQDINHQDWQRTSVWGPMRCMTSTRKSIVISTHFDTIAEPFNYLSGASGTIHTDVYPMRVLGTGSGRLYLPAETSVRSANIIGLIGPYSRYIVWSIHTYLENRVPEGNHVDELFGLIHNAYEWGDIVLGRVIFKPNQWACSYGMKMLDVGTKSSVEMRLDFETKYNATFYITDYQIVVFDDLNSANSYVNSREFAIRENDH